MGSLIGILTIIIAGMTAMVEMDIKKVIALSTLSQLGIMIMILGIGNPVLSFFHLISHAFFKAILFICTGLIIHRIKDYQDIRKIGFIYIIYTNIRNKFNSYIFLSFKFSYLFKFYKN